MGQILTKIRQLGQLSSRQFSARIFLQPIENPAQDLGFMSVFSQVDFFKEELGSLIKYENASLK